jgi:hypothetical protein
MPVEVDMLEEPTVVADRFLVKYGPRSAWSSAIAIAENFQDIEVAFEYWKKVADAIKAKLQEGRTR